jgi:dipeptidyl aminopeptidase/acylaminoacyl peptidase
MQRSPLSPAQARLARLGVAFIFIGLAATATAQNAKRAVTFMDVQEMRSAGSEAVSRDGRWMLYTVTTPDWQTAKEQSDIHVVSLQEGVASSKQMTFTKEHNETSPQWSRDGSFFVFASNRNAPSTAESQNQLFVLRLGVGEARRITDAKDGVKEFAFSRDGQWLVFRAGKSGEEQLYRLGVAAIAADPLGNNSRGSPPGLASELQTAVVLPSRRTASTGRELRLEKKFTVSIITPEALDSLTGPRAQSGATRLTEDSSMTVSSARSRRLALGRLRAAPGSAIRGRVLAADQRRGTLRTLLARSASGQIGR